MPQAPLKRPHSFFQSVSAVNSCEISCSLEGDAHHPAAPSLFVVPAALPVQTVRFLDLGYFVSQLRDAIFDVVLPDN
jgi:hypothetical protein